MSVIDTNVLVHSSVTTSPDHARARAALARLTAHGQTRLLTFEAADFRRFGSLIEVVAP